MAYTTPGTRQNEIVRLQSEITNEIQRDAPVIAQGVFGDNKNHPDMAQVSNQQLDDLYRQKYQANDRQWLQAEARRDPVQFEKVTDRIGVTTPPTGQPSTVVDPNAFAGAVMANAAPAPAAPMAPAGSAPALPPPAALPAPTPSPVGAPVVFAPPPVPGLPPPVILGPNGQPLPPTGL